jgi:hypothetical protein
MEFYDVYRGVLQDRGATDAIERLEEHIIHKRKPLAHLRERVESASFEVKSVREGDFSFRYADGTAMLDHFFIKVGFSAGWKAVLDPGDVDAVFSEVEERLNEVAAANHELRMTVPWICVDSRKV